MSENFRVRCRHTCLGAVRDGLTNNVPQYREDQVKKGKYRVKDGTCNIRTSRA